MTNLNDLAQLGQAVWYDYIRRSFITSGELAELIALGVRGVTSNPSILEQAIAGSADYDEELRKLVAIGKSVEEIYEALVFEDIGQAADLLLPGYQATDKLDGYVSLEVSPELAHDTAGTLDEARRLFAALNRPNLMIKVPATSAGIPVITELIGAGINVNVTLIFDIKNYKSVAEAYLAGLEKFLAIGGDIRKVASVASFFISRVDSAVDLALAAKGNEELQGKIAIANSKVAYGLFKNIFSGKRWQNLSAAGARVQRLLWASTGTKNPLYPDTLYVDELIGPETVNTVPPAILNAFKDHGSVAVTLTEGHDAAAAQISQLTHFGIDLAAITKKLQNDGVTAFAKSFETLLASIAEKRDRLLAGKKGYTASLHGFQSAVDSALKERSEERRVGKECRSRWSPDH